MTTAPKTPKEALGEAQELLRANLSVAAREILEWNDTGVLPDGIVRRAAEIVRPFVVTDHIGMAERLLSRICFEQIAAT